MLQPFVSNAGFFDGIRCARQPLEGLMRRSLRVHIAMIATFAESWTAAKDGRTYTFKLRRGVKFHDGSEMTSKDVKASYDKIIFPTAGVASDRQGQYLVVEAVQAPDPYTVVFRLKWPSASFL